MEHFLGALPKDGREWDIQEAFFKLFANSSMDFLLGESTNQLQSSQSNQSEMFLSPKYQAEFGKAFDYSQKLSILRLFAFPFHSLICTPKFQKSNKTIRRFMDDFVDKALDRTKGKYSEKSSESYMFLEALAKHNKDRRALRGHMLNVLFAARDDPASLLSSIFYLLARDRRVWDKLREEILHCLGSRDVDKEITAEEIEHDLPYLRHVIHEGKNCHPVTCWWITLTSF